MDRVLADVAYVRVPVMADEKGEQERREHRAFLGPCF